MTLAWRIRSLKFSQNRWHSTRENLSYVRRFTRTWNGRFLTVRSSCFSFSFGYVMIASGPFRAFSLLRYCVRIFSLLSGAKTFPELTWTGGLIHIKIWTFPHWLMQLPKLTVHHIQSSSFRSRTSNKNFGSFERPLS